ncbi:MAG: tetratricopeptide repeat protein [Bacteroidia bacterium]|nr:tetratricopeptide repeat protein [Bacteroidia bacterium]
MRNFFCITRLFLFTAFLMGFCFSQDEIPDTSAMVEPHIKLYREALPHIDSGRYDKALELLKKSVKQKKDFADAYIKTGYVHYKKGNKKEAMKWLDKGEKLSYRNYELYKMKGILFFEDKKYPQSKQYFDSAYALAYDEKRDDAELYYFRARLMFIGKAYKEALSSADAALDLKPDYMEARKLKAEIRFEQKEWKYCLLELDSLIPKMKETEKDYEMYRMRAKCKYELKDYRGSLKDWNVMTDALPKDEESWIMKGACKIQLNDFSSAIADLDEAIKLNSKNPVSYCYRGLAKGSNKMIAEGLKDLDYAIKLKFDYASAYVNRAALRMAAKDKQGACEDLQKAETLGSENAVKLFDKYCKRQ